MNAETYRGTHRFTVGPGGDFDFGDNLTSADTELVVNFTLIVNHALQVRFPPGADRLALIPAGGWQQWLNHGRRPEKLTANLDYQFWASGAFKMNLQCQHTVADQCGIQNTAGDTVAVETRVTLPGGIVDQANTPVNRYRLSTAASRFQPNHYVSNGRSSLHFEVDREGVEQMTRQAGSQYSGDVTIVWDSEV